MKKLLFLLLTMMLPMMASAQERIGWIYYEKKADGTYKVVKPGYEYSGEITIPSTVHGIKVTEIGDDAFYNQKVTVVHLPITIERIGKLAFGGCNSMTSIEIPENVNYIGQNAFWSNDYLTDIYCYANNVSLGKEIFLKTNLKKVTLHVPEANLRYFTKADQWKKIKNIEATTKRSWAVEQNEREIAEQKRIAEEREREAKRIAEEQAKARQELINDSTLAMQGNADAQLRMAKRYEIGDGVAKDINKALDYYRILGDQGNAEAQVHLGNLYFAGNGVDKNQKEAIELYFKAAEAGNAEAQYNLGRIYYNGEGVKKDEETAIVWIKKSVAQNYALAKTLHNKYEEDHKSYYNNDLDWRIVFPDGQIVGHDKNGGDSYGSVLYTNDFIIKKINYNYFSSYSSFNNVKEGDGLYFPFSNYYELTPKDLSAFESLSIQDKTKMIKFNLQHFSRTVDEITIVNKNEIIGHFVEEKFVPKAQYDAAKAAAEAKAEKARQAKLASYTKRFGFNPSGKSIKQLVAVGRSFSLVNDYLNDYYVGGQNFWFSFAEDTGISKGYRVIMNNKRVGYIYVQNNRIISVTWR